MPATPTAPLRSRGGRLSYRTSRTGRTGRTSRTALGMDLLSLSPHPSLLPTPSSPSPSLPHSLSPPPSLHPPLSLSSLPPPALSPQYRRIHDGSAPCGSPGCGCLLGDPQGVVGEGVGRYTTVTASRMTDAYGASTRKGCTAGRSGLSRTSRTGRRSEAPLSGCIGRWRGEDR